MPCAILIYIKPNDPSVQDTAEALLSIAPFPGFPVTEQPKLRFAVGTFDSWPQLREALRELRARGLVLDSFNCVALQRLFAGKTFIAPNQEPVGAEALPFAKGTALIAWTSGPLADCLRDRIESGARDLKDALSRWLLPRHAADFQDAVQAGKILFWIRVGDAHDERRTCQTLLAHSSNSVGVHDLMLPGER
jgi:hypothetical protein